MTRDEWRRLEELFHAAVARPEEERPAFLAAACGDRPALRRELERLLETDARAEQFLAGTVEASAAAATGLHAGQRIGPYRAVRELGRGGMSSVYLAERSDGEFEHRVAIKVMRFGPAAGEVRRRLLAERQILARLDHPHIAKLYDGGTTEGGLPYFVMEVVDGLPIDEYCDAHRLGVEARLRLFLRVCAAVQYAHRNLVVHRDLKPSNVLVTAAGDPKLLDFGIAKLLDPSGAGGKDEPTSLLLRLGTRGFASPEQLSGAPVTTASDLYSLGVLLFLLLTGQMPFRFPAEASLSEVTEELRRRPPPRPSSAQVAPAAALRGERPEVLARRLAGDLDNILAMMLDPEPERRYGSVESAADDLERHLAGHPVIARPGSWGYRLAKFVRRHRLGVAAATTVAVLILAFGVAMALAERRAVRERQRAEQVSSMLVRLFELAGPAAARDQPLTARDLLDRGAEEVQGLAGQTETQAMLLDVLGSLYEELGYYAEAQRLYGEALEVYRRVLGRRHPRVAESLQHLARAVAKSGELQRAEGLFREALALRRELLGPRHPEVAVTLNSLALALHELGDYAAAEPLYRQALELDRELLGPDHPHYRVTLGNLALLLYDTGAYGEAARLYRDLLARAAEDGEQAAEHWSGLGLSLQAQGELAAARAAFESGLELRRSVFGREHPLVARSLDHLGDLLREQGELAEAEELLEEAYRQRLRLLGDGHAEVADSRASLGRLRLQQGRLAAAEELFQESIATYRRTLAAHHPFLGSPLAGLGRAQALAGRCPQAVSTLEEALTLLPPAHPEAARSREVLAACQAGREP